MQQHQEATAKGLLGKLSSGEKKLEGKIFYLDNLKKRQAALLLEAIIFQGGRVESFLHKDVSFVVTGNREILNGLKKENKEDKHRPGHSKPEACGSRGKALLEKAIRNHNERQQGSSVLANAKAWGVKILFVDAVLFYLKHMNKETLRTKPKKPDKSRVVKAIALRSPYIKIEDISRKYKPLHVQAMNFPVLHYLNRFSPFETPSPVFIKQAEIDDVKNREKSKAESGASAEDSHSALSPSPWRYRKKDHFFCECCHQPFSNFVEHLQSSQHRAFVLDSSNYSLMDQLVSQMLPGFSLISLQPAVDRPSTCPSIPHTGELLPLTDAEMEDAVQELRRQGANVCSLSSSPLRVAASGSPAASVLTGPYPIPNVETPPAKLCPLSPETVFPVQVKEPDISSLVVTKMNLESDHHDPGSQQTQHLNLSPAFDPYSQPPVLSPQVPKSDESLEPHNLNSEPPVLSPQCYSADGSVEQRVCEMDTNFESFIALEESNLVALSGRNLDFWPSNNSVMTTKKRHISTPKPIRCKRRKAMTTNSGGLTEGVVEMELDVASKSYLLPNRKHNQRSDVPACNVEMFLEDHAAQVCPRKQEQINISGLCNVHPSWLGPCIQLFNEPLSSQDSKPSQCKSTSFCIDSTLIPDVGKLLPSSDSDWDCEMLPQLESTAAVGSRHLHLQNCELDKDVLQQPYTWMHDSTYESRLHTVLQPAKSTLFRDEVDQTVFSRTLVQIVEVQH